MNPMRNRIIRFKGRIITSLVVFLTIPLLGWNALPKLILDRNFENHPATGSSALSFTSAESSSARNVETGQKLFMGNLHFKNGGPPCMGCHSIGSNGILGGGALGPDLTSVTTRRSQSELEAILSNADAAKAPVMQPIYAEHPLTAEEQANLLAFMLSAAGQTETNKEWLVIGISLAGFAAAVMLLGLLYRGRLRGVRKLLLKKAQLQNR
jgi:mono/diheme cytochrome c family protein